MNPFSPRFRILRMPERSEHNRRVWGVFQFSGRGWRLIATASTPQEAYTLGVSLEQQRRPGKATPETGEPP